MGTRRTNRKTDKYRLKEGRGIGRGKEYKPWIRPHEFSRSSVAYRFLGWKTARIHVSLSYLEYKAFLCYQYENNVIEIREQFPLLPLEQTVLIANELGIRHAALNNKKGKELIMTTDLLITIKEGNKVYDIARTIKRSDELSNPRVREKFLIEQEYFARKNIDWGIVTEREIDHIKALNLQFLYQDYFWDIITGYNKEEISSYQEKLKDILIRYNYEILRSTEELDRLLGWQKGQGLNLFKYLLVHKDIQTDLSSQRINFHTMKIWFPV